jgi:hypothetical protein
MPGTMLLFQGHVPDFKPTTLRVYFSYSSIGRMIALSVTE